MAWARNGTSNTLSATGDTITISDLTAKKFNQFLYHVIPSGTINNYLAFNNDTTASNYALRYNYNGGTDSPSPQTLQYFNVNNADELVVVYTCNISGEEKLSIAFSADSYASGYNNPPSRGEFTSKWVTTSGQFSRADVINTQTGSFDTGSNLTVLNGDTTLETILGNKIQSGSRFEATDTRKIYYGALPSVTFEDDFDTDDWTDQGSDVAVNTSNERLDFTFQTGGNGTTVYDLGAGNVNDTAWVLRWEIFYSSISSSGNGHNHAIGLTVNDQTFELDTATDTRWMFMWGEPTNSGGNKSGIEVDNNTTSNGFPTDSVTSAMGAGTQYYMELKRTGTTTGEWKVWTGGYEQTLVESVSATGLANITGLRYIKLTNRGDTGRSGSAVGYIDNIKFYNGVTSTDFTWTEEV